MKKLVIETQYMENYGDAQSPYMKFKGGSTYVMFNCGDELTENEIATIIARVRPYITTTLADSNGGCEEYITSHGIIDHKDAHCADFETAIQFSFDGADVNFIKRLDNQSEAGYLRKSIIERTETWTNNRENYKVEFLMEDGEFCKSNAEVNAWLDANDSEEEILLPEAG
jgi:hypothetical protein|tara:strand:- start:86 stop:595 length:510 start_codon:yes stop_codon:yes gene_type:complete